MSGARRLGKPFRYTSRAWDRRIGCEPGRLALRRLAWAESRHALAFRRPQHRSVPSFAAPSASVTVSPSAPTGGSSRRSAEAGKPCSGTRRREDREDSAGRVTALQRSRSVRTATRSRSGSQRRRRLSTTLRTGRQTRRCLSAQRKHPGLRLQPGRKAARIGEPERDCEHLGRCDWRRRVAALAGAVAAFAVRFSPDGKLLAVGDSSGAVVLWDARQPASTIGQPLVGHGGGVHLRRLRPDGNSTRDRKRRRKPPPLGRRHAKTDRSAAPGSTTGGSVNFFPDGKHVLGVFQSGTGDRLERRPRRLGGEGLQRRPPQPHPRRMD